MSERLESIRDEALRRISKETDISKLRGLYVNAVLDLYNEYKRSELREKLVESGY